jgi:hypothetical protein
VLPLAVYEDFASTIGAFLSGIGSVLTGFLAIRYERKRSKQDCEDRFKAYQAGIKQERAAERAGRKLDA